MIQTDEKTLKWILNLVDAISCRERWHLYHSKFEFDIDYRASNKHQATNALSRQQTTSAYIEPVEDDISVKVIDTGTLDCIKVRLENDHQTLAQIDDYNGSRKVATVPTNAEFLQHQAAKLFFEQAALSVETANVENTANKNGLIVQVAPNDGAVQIVDSQELWNRLLYQSHLPVIVATTVNDTYTTPSQGSFTGHLWPIMGM